MPAHLKAMKSCPTLCEIAATIHLPVFAALWETGTFASECVQGDVYLLRLRQ